MNAQVTNLPSTERRSVLVSLAAKFSMEPAAFEQTLRATVFPKDGSREQFAAFLVVANEYGLNPLTKEIYAFPTQRGGVQPIVSIDGWCNLMNSHPSFNGVEFDDHVSQDGKTVTAITAKIWRKDREKPIVATEYMAECARNTEPWQKWPRRMLRHKALIQCARYAFGFAGIVDPDEAERMGVRDATARGDDPPAPPAARAIEHKPQQPAQTAAKREDADLELAEAGRNDGQSVTWQDDPPPLQHEATAADVFDGAQWLRDLEGAFGGCESMADLGEQQARLMTQSITRALPPDRKKAKAIFDKHYARLDATILDAG